MRALIVLVFAVFASAAFAQTGGRMGGGSWGGGGGGGGGFSSGGGSYSSGGGSYSGGGGFSSTPSYSHSSSDWNSSSSSSSSSDSSAGCGDMIGLYIVGGFFMLGMALWAWNDMKPKFPAVREDDVDLSVLHIALDGRARQFVQRGLAKIAETADTKTVLGRTDMLRKVATMLRTLRDTWIYAGAVNHPVRKMGKAKPAFDAAVDDARSRFREEVISNVDGTTQRREASEYTPRSDEGAGLILVSIIIAANKELFTVPRIKDGDELRRALEAASQIAVFELVAVEIIWQPAIDRDRLSSMELEAKYPDLIKLPSALAGKTFCNYCSGPFPAELVSCPHCGAPAPGRAAWDAA